MKSYTKEQLAQIPEFKKGIKNIERQINKLEKQKNFLQNLVNNLGLITEFYRNYALQIDDNKNRIKIQSIPDCNRHAEIYHKATTPEKTNNWGIYLRNYNARDFSKREKWLGTGHTKEKALIIGKDWVVSGTGFHDP